MEKYGVEESDEKVKTASESTGDKCPTCNAPLRDYKKTGVLLCPNCGSKPFENKDATR